MRATLSAMTLAPEPFRLDPRIEAASILVGSLALCEVRLQADARWPWLVLVPRIAGATEIDHLPPELRAVLVEEAVRAGEAARAIGAALERPVEKLNVGALGNVVAQLHVHVVGRRRDDPAWPGPVWGSGTAEPYSEALAARALDAARRALRPGS